MLLAVFKCTSIRRSVSELEFAIAVLLIVFEITDVLAAVTLVDENAFLPLLETVDEGAVILIIVRYLQKSLAMELVVQVITFVKLAANPVLLALALLVVEELAFERALWGIEALARPTHGTFDEVALIDTVSEGVSAEVVWYVFQPVTLIAVALS